MKRKYSDAAYAKQRLREAYMRRDDDDEAVEARDWYEEWAMSTQHNESNDNHRSKE